MGVLFGLLTSLSIGLSDLFGRRVVHQRGPITTGVAMQFVAIFASLAALLVVPGTVVLSDLVVGLLSGLGLGIGLVCYFGGLDRSSSTVVAPVVATMSAVIPFVYAIVRGAPPTALAVVGALMAFCGLALITFGGGRSEHVTAGLRWALFSGLGYGFGLSVIIEASEGSGSWPAVAQRLAAFLLMIVIARVMRSEVVPPRGLRISALVAGVFAGASTIFYLIGVQADATSAVVAASLFPAVTVVVGRVFYRDVVVRLQAVGIAIVLVGVIGVAVG